MRSRRHRQRSATGTLRGVQLLPRCAVSDSNSDEFPQTAPSTIDAIVKRCEPMGDLGRFAIDDLTADEEDEFFAILEDV